MTTVYYLKLCINTGCVDEPMRLYLLKSHYPLKIA